MVDLSPPRHGGDLAAAIARFGGRADDWIDCSTGIAPEPYPLPAIPATVWQRLPDSDADLLRAAGNYYDCDQLLALPGSQAAIGGLPRLRARSRVGIVGPTYAEHGWQWRQHGHDVRELALQQVDAALAQLDVLIVVNPDNPTGRQLPAAQLLEWCRQLAPRGGWLIVDEAFADATPQHSLLPQIGQAGLMVLRSVGKFFGLAGMRLGFIATGPAVRETMQKQLGPWPVSGLAQWAGTLALADHAWQQQQRQRLSDASRWLQATLTEAGLPPAGTLPLLHWCPAPQALHWHTALARQRIWCRYFDQLQALRFGPVAAMQQTEFRRRLLAAADLMTTEHRISQ